MNLLESPMSKRKPAKSSKQARSPKITAKAQRAHQAVVRSPKPSHLRSVAVGSTDSPPKRHNVSKQEAPVVEKATAALPVAEKPTTSLPAVEKPTTGLQGSREQTMRDNDSKQAFGFSSATASVQAYQAKLQEIIQANMQFGFEFAQRLAKIRSPFEIPGLLAELTTKQLAMFQNLLYPRQSSR
jgi:hypothetical protein